MQLITTAFIFLMTAVLPAQTHSHGKGRLPPCPAEDYAVYSALLNSPNGLLHEWPSKNVSIQARTSIIERSPEMIKLESDGWGKRRREGNQQKPAQDTLDDFYSKSRSSCRLGHHIVFAGGYHLALRSLTSALKKDVSSRMYEGIWEFSRVGYSTSKNEAVVYAAYECGGTCGTGTYYLLNRHDRDWVITNELLIWIR